MNHLNTDPEAIPLDKRIIFALDFDTPKEAQDWVKELEDQITFFKVGLQLFLAGGFDIVDWIINRDLDVMLDLKLYDVPRTVYSAIRQIERHSPTFVTVHGDKAIMQAAAQAAETTQILAVTLLTSLDQNDINDLGTNFDPNSLVLKKTEQSIQAGLSGVVCSGLEVKDLRNKLGKNFYIVVPGIRSKQEKNGDDQKRTVTAAEAFRAGADHIVAGSLIKDSNNPVKQTEVLLQDIEDIFH